MCFATGGVARGTHDPAERAELDNGIAPVEPENTSTTMPRSTASTAAPNAQLLAMKPTSLLVSTPWSSRNDTPPSWHARPLSTDVSR